MGTTLVFCGLRVSESMSGCSQSSCSFAFSLRRNRGAPDVCEMALKGNVCPNSLVRTFAGDLSIGFEMPLALYAKSKYFTTE